MTTSTSEPSAQMYNPFQPGDRAPRWQIDLSGGGVRAALCAIGAVFWLREVGEYQHIGRVVSVSGGSIVNGALHRQRPDGDELGEVLGHVYRAITNRLRTFAFILVWIGCGAWLAVARYLGEQVTHGYGFWIMCGAIVVWLVLLGVLRIAPLFPLVSLVSAVILINVDLEPHEEWRVLGVLTGILPLTAWLVVAGYRHRVVGLNPYHTMSSAFWYLGVGLPVVLFALVAELRGWVFETSDWRPWGWFDATRLFFWGLAGSALLLQLVGPYVVRAYLSGLMDLRGATLGECCKDSGVTHVYGCAEIREDVAGFFVGGPRAAIFISESTDINSLKRLGDAGDVGLVTAVQSSASFPGVMTPALPFAVRPISNLSSEQWAPPIDLPLMVDAGVHGTLGSSFLTLGWDIETQGSSPRDHVGDAACNCRLVLDAAVYRGELRWWPATMIPKIGSQLVNARIAQMILRSLVTAERDRVGGRTDEFRAAVTGARMQPDLGTDQLERTAWDAYLRELRTAADSTRMWWPTRRVGARCIAAGIAACVETTAGARGRSSEREMLEDARTAIMAAKSALTLTRLPDPPVVPPLPTV